MFKLQILIAQKQITWGVRAYTTASCCSSEP